MRAAENTNMSDVDFFEPRALTSMRDYEDFLNSDTFLTLDRREQAQNLEDMKVITARIRTQLRFIIHSVRCWRARHTEFDSHLRLRYSAYEGSLCYADLRRHWRYYRHAMREYCRMRR